MCEINSFAAVRAPPTNPHRGGGAEANHLVHCLDFYHKSPDSGERHYKSRT